MSFGLGDVTLAIQGAIGTLAALEYRERTGQGQFVDVSQIDSATATLPEPLLDLQMNARLPLLRGNAHTFFCPHGIFPAAGENRWIAVAVRDTAEWSALAAAIGRDDWVADPGLATAAGRRARAPEIDAEIAAWCSTRDRDGTADALAAVGVPAAPVLELPERNEHPQFTERGFMLAHEGGGFDPCRIYATPWLLTATPPEMTRPAPALGEQNEYVFKDVLGLTDAEYDALVDSAVIA
jgi:crotonobetainyl-CoA:carnitine CoA-transferase CaiB-like acyl-CoA transferase